MFSSSTRIKLLVALAMSAMVVSLAIPADALPKSGGKDRGRKVRQGRGLRPFERGQTDHDPLVVKGHEMLFTGTYAMTVPAKNASDADKAAISKANAQKLQTLHEQGELFTPVFNSAKVRAQRVTKDTDLEQHEGFVKAAMVGAVKAMATHVDSLLGKAKLPERDGFASDAAYQRAKVEAEQAHAKKARDIALTFQTGYSSNEFRHNVGMPETRQRARAIRGAFAAENLDKAAIERMADTLHPQLKSFLFPEGDAWGNGYMLGEGGFNEKSVMLNMPGWYAGKAMEAIVGKIYGKDKVQELIHRAVTADLERDASALTVARLNSRVQEIVYAASKVVQAHYETIVQKNEAKGPMRLMDHKMRVDDTALDKESAAVEDFMRKLTNLRSYAELKGWYAYPDNE